MIAVNTVHSPDKPDCFTDFFKPDLVVLRKIFNSPGNRHMVDGWLRPASLEGTVGWTAENKGKPIITNIATWIFMCKESRTIPNVDAYDKELRKAEMKERFREDSLAVFNYILSQPEPTDSEVHVAADTLTARAKTLKAIREASNQRKQQPAQAAPKKQSEDPLKPPPTSCKQFATIDTTIDTTITDWTALKAAFALLRPLSGGKLLQLSKQPLFFAHEYSVRGLATLTGVARETLRKGLDSLEAQNRIHTPPDQCGKYTTIWIAIQRGAGIAFVPTLSPHRLWYLNYRQHSKHVAAGDNRAAGQAAKRMRYYLDQLRDHDLFYEFRRATPEQS